MLLLIQGKIPETTPEDISEGILEEIQAGISGEIQEKHPEAVPDRILEFLENSLGTPKESWEKFREESTKQSWKEFHFQP